jgi:hypothetical protein
VIHVVVSCAERKSHPAQTDLTVGRSAGPTFEARLAKWLEAITAAQVGHRVADLYQGEHWSVARSLSSDVVSVWTASAGFGLLSLEDNVPSYDATFSPGHPSSVSHARSALVRRSELSRWWSAIQMRPTRARSDTLSSLIADGPVIIAASQPYLQAMRGEILDAHDQQDHALVLSTAGSVPSDLSHLRLPCDGRLRSVLGGSMGAVSVRLAKELASIPEGEFTVTSAVDRTKRLMAASEPLPRYERTTLTDIQVVEFIEHHRRKIEHASASRLLRELRDSGMACEQSRFRRLFAESGTAQ